jgi:hypothetical protein
VVKNSRPTNKTIANMIGFGSGMATGYVNSNEVLNIYMIPPHRKKNRAALFPALNFREKYIDKMPKVNGSMPRQSLGKISNSDAGLDRDAYSGYLAIAKARGKWLMPCQITIHPPAKAIQLAILSRFIVNPQHGEDRQIRRFTYEQLTSPFVGRLMLEKPAYDSMNSLRSWLRASPAWARQVWIFSDWAGLMDFCSGSQT